jgi:hypothetical protein
MPLIHAYGWQTFLAVQVFLWSIYALVGDQALVPVATGSGLVFIVYYFLGRVWTSHGRPPSHDSKGLHP